jgi:hypothetical protein
MEKSDEREAEALQGWMVEATSTQKDRQPHLSSDICDLTETYGFQLTPSVRKCFFIKYAKALLQNLPGWFSAASFF